MTSIRLAVAAVIGFTIWTATRVVAQDYPHRTIRIVVPFSAGGGTDILARLLGQRFHEAMGGSRGFYQSGSREVREDHQERRRQT